MWGLYFLEKMETWIKIYNWRYEVSENWKVRWNIIKNQYWIFTKIKELKPRDNKRGYQTVNICIDNKKKNQYIHRLVAEAFIPNPENKQEVNHKNWIKTDNRVENLEWSTRSENMKHSINQLWNKLKIWNKNKILLEKGRFKKEFDSQKDAGIFLWVTWESIWFAKKNNRECKGYRITLIKSK